MIFVTIGDISNRLYTGGFKISAKGFWFSVTALFNNIYVITFKMIRQLFFMVDVFMNRCYIFIS